MTLAKFIEENRKLAEEATKGPWTVLGDGKQAFNAEGMVADCGIQWTDDGDESGEEQDWERGKINAAFIASARTALPLALDLLEYAMEALVSISIPAPEMTSAEAYGMVRTHEQMATRVRARLDVMSAGETTNQKEK